MASRVIPLMPESSSKTRQSSARGSRGTSCAEGGTISARADLEGRRACQSTCCGEIVEKRRREVHLVEVGVVAEAAQARLSTVALWHEMRWACIEENTL